MTGTHINILLTARRQTANRKGTRALVDVSADIGAGNGITDTAAKICQHCLF